MCRLGSADVLSALIGGQVGEDGGGGGKRSIPATCYVLTYLIHNVESVAKLKGTAVIISRAVKRSLIFPKDQRSRSID